MPIFAPPYRQSAGQETYLARQQRHNKRKRRSGTNSSSASSTSSDDSNDTPRQKQEHEPSTKQDPPWTSRPVSKTDPYYIAGHSREAPLPPGPFPHAAINTEKHHSRRSKASIEEELATLKPPVYALRDDDEQSSNPTSLRRRHLDNMTAILHMSFMRGDWERAMRAWSLLIRTDVAGMGVDLRRCGRWGIGAELLMRSKSQQHSRTDSSNAVEIDGEQHGDDEDSPFLDTGFELAKQYYERLILQYPHTRTTQHTFNATQIYPVFFGIWIYQAQDRSRRARRRLHRNHQRSSGEEDNSGIDLDDSNSVDGVSAEVETRQIKAKELEDADAIAQRMDDLLLGPPYDTDHQLVLLHAMVELWRADLHEDSSRIESSASPLDDRPRGLIEENAHHDRVRECRIKASEMLSKLVTMGADLPDELQALADSNQNS